MHLPQPNRKKKKTFHSSEPDTDIQISRVADLDVSEQNFVWLYLALTSEWLLSGVESAKSAVSRLAYTNTWLSGQAQRSVLLLVLNCLVFTDNFYVF